MNITDQQLKDMATCHTRSECDENCSALLLCSICDAETERPYVLDYLAMTLRAKCAEVEELRKALRMIAEWKPGMTYGGNVFDAQEIARKALEGKE